MVRRRFFVVGLLAVLMQAVCGFANAPPNTFHASPYPKQIQTSFSWREGGYLGFGAAMLHNNKDVNILSGEAFGDPIDAALQFSVGWGITPRVAAEADIRLAMPHAIFDGTYEKEMSARVDLTGRYALLPQWGQFSPGVTVTPYLKGGALIYIMAVKGNGRDESKVAGYGTGLLAGGGLEADFGTHPVLYLDLSVDGAVVILDGKKVSGVTVTANGIAPQIGGSLSCGIRF